MILLRKVISVCVQLGSWAQLVKKVRHVSLLKKTKSTKTNKQKHVNISVRDVLLENPRFNTKGSYTCTCKPGRHGDGLTCEGKTLKV